MDDTTARSADSHTRDIGVAGFTVAAAIAGAITGALSVRNLRALRYRYDDAADSPPPTRVGWVLPVATLAATIAAATIVAATIVAARLSPDRSWALLVLAALVAAGPWLAAVDLDVRRLPDRVLGPVAAASLLAVIIARDASDQPADTRRDRLGPGRRLLLLGSSTRRRRAGFRRYLAAILGLTVGVLGLGVPWWALLLSSVLCLGWSAVARRGKPSGTRVAFGPWMLLGSLLAVPVLALIAV